MILSNRVLNMPASPIRKLLPHATNAKKRGKKVYHLNIGQPDIETPKIFLEAINQYDSKIIKYSNSQGESILIEAVKKYYARDGITFDTEDIIVTNGGSEALTFSIFSTCNPGDEILVPEPFYTNYNGFAGEVDVKVVPITTKAENGFRLPRKEEITKLITSRTKAILFSSPGNPTGAVLNIEEMNLIAEIANEYNLYIISDEVYRGMVFDGVQSLSMGIIEGIEDKLIITDSVSKRYSACGARIGSICSHNKNLMKNILKLAQARLCVATLEQIGAAALYELPQSYTDKIRDEYQARRDVAFAALKAIPSIVVQEPKGAFYMIIKLPIEDAENFIVWMLEEFELDGETVMMAPAEGFYATPGLGKNEVRIAYVLNTEDMEKAMKVFIAGLEAYMKK